MMEFLVDDLPQIVFICAGLYIIARSMADTFFPKRQGIVVEIGLPSACTASRSNCTMRIIVKLVDGTIERAEISACTACLEKIKEGDMVGLSHIGGRMIAQKGVSWCR